MLTRCGALVPIGIYLRFSEQLDHRGGCEPPTTTPQERTEPRSQCSENNGKNSAVNAVPVVEQRLVEEISALCGAMTCLRARLSSFRASQNLRI